MQLLREYAMNIITVSILAVIFEIILPKNNFKKYISVIIGLVVMTVIISPVKGILGDFELFVIEDAAAENEGFDIRTNELVAAEFEKRLEEEIQKGILTEFNTECVSDIELVLSEKGEIAEIKSVSLVPFSETAADFVSEQFGIEREKIGGK